MVVVSLSVGAEAEVMDRGTASLVEGGGAVLLMWPDSYSSGSTQSFGHMSQAPVCLEPLNP